MDHHSGHCPICKKAFTEADDVVICPVCGAPYHRACYRQAGHCLFEARHGPGFEYRDPSAPEKPPPGRQQAEGGALCPACQTVNEASNIFCERCGAPLREGGPTRAGGAFGQGFPLGGPFAAGTEGPSGAAEIDGISQADWASYIGNSAPVYLFRLSAMAQRERKLSFMFSAFFLSPFYFAYRKMWGWAALALLVTILSYATQFFGLAAGAGVNLLSFWPAEAVVRMADNLGLLWWGVNLLFGIFALYWYRRKGAKVIHGLREQYQQDYEYRSALGQAGGVSVAGAVVALGLVAAFIMGMAAVMNEETLVAIYHYVNSGFGAGLF